MRRIWHSDRNFDLASKNQRYHCTCLRLAHRLDVLEITICVDVHCCFKQRTCQPKKQCCFSSNRILCVCCSRPFRPHSKHTRKPRILQEYSIIICSWKYLYTWMYTYTSIYIYITINSNADIFANSYRRGETWSATAFAVQEPATVKQKICLSVNMEFSLHDFGGQRL